MSHDRPSPGPATPAERAAVARAEAATAAQQAAYYLERAATLAEIAGDSPRAAELQTAAATVEALAERLTHRPTPEAPTP